MNEIIYEFNFADPRIGSGSERKFDAKLKQQSTRTAVYRAAEESLGKDCFDIIIISKSDRIHYPDVKRIVPLSIMYADSSLEYMAYEDDQYLIVLKKG